MKTTFPIHIALALSVSSTAAVSQVHTHGSMVGALKPTSVVVWTRASAAANVTALINSTPSTTGATETAAVAATAANDFTVKIAVTNLTAGFQYYYATKIINPSTPTSFVIGPWGTFETPPTTTTPAKVRFLASGDVFYKSQFGIFDKMRAVPSAFYLNLGDLVYADTATTQAEYWDKHKDARNHSSWKNFIKTLPVEAVWDDHEVINDWDKNTNATLVAYGTKAFKDYYPLPTGSTEIYRTLQWGSGVELFLLDLRLYRGVNNAPSVASKPMLGATQKAWLKNALKNSSATFKIICSSVPLRYGNQTLDDWDGYLHERKEILDYVQANDIQNVVILSSDNHLISVHQHREGIREFVCGPLAMDVRPRNPAPSEVRFRATVRNYAAISVDPTVTPATLTIEFFDPKNVEIYSEVVKAEEPAKFTVLSDEPTGGFCLQGPFHFKNRGSIEIPRAEPGNYKITFDAKANIRYQPTDISVNVPAGSEVVVAGRFNELPGAKVFLGETFEKPLTGHTIIDETGATGGPSAWVVNGGLLQQGSRIGGPVSGADSNRPGTMLIMGNAAWFDYTTSVRMKSHERGRIGVVFRYQNKDNYYRFFMDRERPLRRLEKKVNGVFTTLAEEKIPYLSHNFHDVQCVANRNNIRVVLDGEELFNVTDTTLRTGKVGLYVWQIKLSDFDDLAVQAGDTAKPPVKRVMSDNFNDQKITGWTIQDHATRSGPSFWVEGITQTLLQLAKIGDTVTSQPLANPGSVCIATPLIPNDIQFSVSMVNFDEHAMGVVFRYKDAANHYRFSWNLDDRKRQLQKVANGVWSVLWQDRTDYNMGQWYRIRVLAVGSRLRLFIDGEPIADVTDTSHPFGSVGMYVWQTAGILFENALVQTPLDELPVLVAVTTKNRITKIHGRAANSAGEVYGIGLAFSKTPPIPLSWLNPADPRVIEIAPDFLFLETLRSSPLWNNFHGKLDANGRFTAQVNWPFIAALKGTKMYAAGWTGDVSKNPVRDVFPTVAIIYP